MESLMKPPVAVVLAAGHRLADHRQKRPRVVQQHALKRAAENVVIFDAKRRSWEAYLAGIGASGALMASASVMFVIV